MKISPHWLRDFVDLTVDYRRLADELTLAGVAVEGITGEGESTVFEMEITTNRPDAMNHYGVAREASALYDLPLKPIEPKLPAGRTKDDPGKSEVTIEIQEPELCARFTGREIRGTQIKASPEKIASRLALIDQRPISNAVDATNYVLWESGKPTHVFDLDLLEGRRLVIRRARAGETLKTLDGVDRKLTTDDLVVADAVKPVALAGVMGGYDTMITEKSRNILIESAWFDPVSVRLTARRQGMHTDASHRFERGADWAATPLACRRVAELILETGGGQLEGGLIDAIGRQIERPCICLRPSEVRRILGQEIAEQEVARILRRLGFEVSGDKVAVPTWRLDVEREIDLIEEIARIYGYNRFPNTLPAFAGAVIEPPDAAKDTALHTALLALGYNQVVSLSFVSAAEAQQFSSATPAALENPISEEAAVMRTSLVPSMVNMLAYNLNRGVNDVRLFEAANVYELVGTKTEERKQIAIGVTGQAIAADVHQPGRAYSFFDLKGDVETLLGKFQHQSIYFDDSNRPDYYHPYRYARAVLDGSMVARLGQLHPEVAAPRKLKQDVYLAEIYLDRLYRHGLRPVRYRPISRYPAVDRDFSFLFNNAITFERIRAAIDALHIGELQSFEPIEIFRGGAVPAGQYSVLLRAEFQSVERTLRDDEVALWAERIIATLKTLGGTQRA